jgi:hypothetical protein
MSIKIIKQGKWSGSVCDAALRDGSQRSAFERKFTVRIRQHYYSVRAHMGGVSTLTAVMIG